MSSNVPINPATGIAAPTPQNTPLTHAPISAGLSRPTVPDISEDPEADEDVEGGATGTGATVGDDDDDDDDEEDDVHESVVVGDPNQGSSLSDAQKMMLTGLVQAKLSRLIGKSSGYIENLSVPVKKNVEALKGIQAKRTALQNQFKREILELERKYLELSQPLYDRRDAIINGKATATEEEIAAGEEESQKDDPEFTPLPKDVAPSAEGIPEFWLTALRTHVGLSEIITDRDAGALKFLTDIRLSYLPTDAEKPGFKLSFYFAPNEYFENDVLTKTYIYQPEVGYSGDFLYERAVGCEIKWKADKDLTKEFEIKKQRNKNTNRTRLVRKAHPTESFFNFFEPPLMPSDEAIEEGKVEEEELSDIEERVEIDYQIGEDIKERIIPHAIDFFTGKALEYEEIDDDDDDFDDDDDDEGSFDDDDSDSEPEPPKRRGKGGNQPPNAEECKQQ